MTRRRTLALLLGVPLTVAAYGVVLLITAFVACGISGCSGGGFGPSFSPVETQIGLAVAGLVLLPLVVLSLPGWPRLARAAAGAAAVLGGSVLAMVLLDLGPHGCPADQARATVRADAYDAGAATCSGDRAALP